MTELANFFYPSPIYSIITVGAAGGIGFIIGYLLRSGILRKYKSRVLEVENEMLANHSRILELEKEVSDLKKGNSSINGRQVTTKTGLKAS